MKISLIHPSRSRPHKAFSTAKRWFERAGIKVSYTLSLDNDDPTIHIYEKLYCVESFWIENGIDGICYDDNKSVVEAANVAAAAASYDGADILLYLSDDFECPQDWAINVLKEFEGVTEPTLLKVDDCLQPFQVPVLTIPIMNRALYEKLGYFWNPQYKRMFVDEDLYWTARKLGALKFAPHLKFPHEHVSIGKAEQDDTYRNSANNWEQGKAVFAKRKALGFPV